MRNARGHPQDPLRYLGTAVELLEATPMAVYARTMRARVAILDIFLFVSFLRLIFGHFFS